MESYPIKVLKTLKHFLLLVDKCSVKLFPFVEIIKVFFFNSLAKVKHVVRIESIRCYTNNT